MHKYTSAKFFSQGRSTVNTILNVALIFISDVYEKGSSEGDSEERRIQRSDVKPPRTVFLSEEDVRLMQSFREEFDRIGGLCVCVLFVVGVFHIYILDFIVPADVFSPVGESSHFPGRKPVVTSQLESIPNIHGFFLK